jgi:hypothetical protein
MGFRHVALLTLDDECDVEALLEALRGLPAEIPELRSYVVARDAGLVDGNATVVVVADFDDESGWRTYTDHPAHQLILADRIRPHLVSRTAAQHET